MQLRLWRDCKSQLKNGVIQASQITTMSVTVMVVWEIMGKTFLGPYRSDRLHPLAPIAPVGFNPSIIEMQHYATLDLRSGI